MRSTDRHTSVQASLGGILLDAEGRDSGHIRDLLVDRDTGRVDFVRVAIEPGGSQAPARTIAIPWSAVRPPGGNGQPWQARVRRETLAKMARFDAAQPA